MAKGNALRGGVARAAEAAVSVVAVSFFFGALLGLLNFLFPRGASLGDLLRRGPAGTAEFSSSSGQELVADGLDGGSVAVLAQAHHDVKARRGNTIAWTSARTGMALNAEDAVQTSRRSSAVIRFDDKNRLDLGPNSLVILRDTAHGLLETRRRSSMVISEGEIHGQFDPESGAPLDVEVTLPNGTARVGAALAGSDFRIQVNPDKSSTVIVEKGAADVSANGVTVRVAERQYTRVALTGAPEAPRSLLPAPEILAPRRGASFPFREIRPPVRLAWSPVRGVDSYRLLIASDSRFQNVVHDAPVTGTEFTHGNLPPGRYWWQVAGLCQGGECTLRRTGEFRIVQDQGPPLLEVAFPEEIVTGDHVALTGKAESGVRVFIAGEEIPVDAKGRFSHRIALRPGLNVVVVEAVDRLGNVSYRSKIVNAKY